MNVLSQRVSARTTRRLRSAGAAASLLAAAFVGVAVPTTQPAAAAGGTPTILNAGDASITPAGLGGTNFATYCDRYLDDVSDFTRDGCSVNGFDGSGGTSWGTVKQWLESPSLTINPNETSRNSSEIRVSALIKHDTDDTLKYLYFDRDLNGTDETSGATNRIDLTGASQQSVNGKFVNIAVSHFNAYSGGTIGSAYTLVFARSLPAGTVNPTWGARTGSPANNEGDGNRGNGNVRIKVETAGGGVSAVSSSKLFVVKGGANDGNDWPGMFNQARVNSPGRATDTVRSGVGSADGATLLDGLSLATSATRRYYFNADDQDVAGCDYAESVAFRYRRISDGTISVTADATDGAGLAKRGGDNLATNYIEPVSPPDRGRWVLEGYVVNEDNCNDYGGSGGNPGQDDSPMRGWWQWVATIDVNTATLPTVTAVTPSSSAFLSGAAATATATVDTNTPSEATAKVQMLNWSGNDNVIGNADDILVESSDPNTASASTSVSLNTNRPPGTYTWNVRAMDNGHTTTGDGSYRTSNNFPFQYTIKNNATAGFVGGSCPTGVKDNQVTCVAQVLDPTDPTGGKAKATPTGTVTWSVMNTPGGGNPSTVLDSGTCGLNQQAIGDGRCDIPFTAVNSDSYYVFMSWTADTAHFAPAAGTPDSAADFPINPPTYNAWRRVKISNHPTTTGMVCGTATMKIGETTTCEVTVTDTSLAAQTQPTGTVKVFATAMDFASETCVLDGTGAPPNQSKCTVVLVAATLNSSAARFANYLGGSHLSSVSPSQFVNVTKHSVQATLDCGGSLPLVDGVEVTCTATVTSSEAEAIRSAPTGNATLYLNGKGIIAGSTNSAGGNVTCLLVANEDGYSSSCGATFTPLANGGYGHDGFAFYGGDAKHRSSRSSSIRLNP